MGPASRTEWARGLFAVGSIVVLAVAFVAAALHAETFAVWLFVVWILAFLGVYIAVTVAEVRGRPPGVSVGAALRRAYGLWPLNNRDILAFTCLIAAGIVLLVEAIRRL